MLPEKQCMIIDDEPKAIELLKQRLKILFPNLKVVDTFTNWTQGVEALRTKSVDILFLDISMPEKSGIDMLKFFPHRSFEVIYVTAHAEYAVDAIKLSAVGYVLKPIDDYELSFAIEKALERLDGKEKAGTESGGAKPSNTSIKLGIPNIKGVDYINPEQILYFESVNKYTKVVTKEYSIVSSYNLAEFKKIIDDSYFFQVHRSYIVNLHHVKRYETSGSIVMEDDMQIPVSKSIRAEFMNTFSKISRIAGNKGS